MARSDNATETVLSGFVGHDVPSATTAFRVGRRWCLAGDPGESAAVERVIADYEQLTGRRAPDDAALRATIGQQVTLAIQFRNTYGAPGVSVTAGRIVQDHGGGLGLLPKGSRRWGRRVDPREVLDMERGHNVALLRERLLSARAAFPAVFDPLEAETFTRIPKGHTGAVSLVLFGTLRMPDCAVPGAIWFITDYDADEDIVNGAVVVPPSAAVSEHGSAYGRDLLRRYEVVPQVASCTFHQALVWGDLAGTGWDGYRKVLQEVFGT